MSKKSLVGYTYKGFKMRWDITPYGYAVVHSEILKYSQQISNANDKPVKVRITIEELPKPKGRH